MYLQMGHMKCSCDTSFNIYLANVLGHHIQMILICMWESLGMFGGTHNCILNLSYFGFELSPFRNQHLNSN